MKNISHKQDEFHPNRSVQPVGFPGLPDGWITETTQILAADEKTHLFGVFHRQEPRQNESVLFILHGFGEHSGRYFHFPHYLQNAFGAIYIYDHRGHGRSEGLRGHISNFDEFTADAKIQFEFLKNELCAKQKSSDIHLLGHSMGGLIALRLLGTYPELKFSSATVSAPFLKLKNKIPWLKRFASKALVNTWASVQLRSELETSALSHDPHVVAAYLKDRLVHDRITPGFFESMMGAISKTLESKQAFSVPVQFLIPEADRIVDPATTLNYAERLIAPAKGIEVYSNFFHESFNELGKERAFSDLSRWVNQYKG